MAHNLLGMCYSSIGSYGNAIISVGNAVANDPDNFQYHFNLASLFAQTGNYYGSKKELETTLKLNADFKKAQDALLRLNEFLESK